MPISTLAEVNRSSKYWAVRVYVSRLWHHRGGTDNGPIKHTDMVLIDKQGNHMYGEIPTDCVSNFMNTVEEGKVYELSRFMVYPKKTHFRPVEGQWMIKLGRYTQVEEHPGLAPEFPLCTFSLTPITDLTNPTDLPHMFTGPFDGECTYTGAAAQRYRHPYSAHGKIDLLPGGTYRVSSWSPIFSTDASVPVLRTCSPCRLLGIEPALLSDCGADRCSNTLNGIPFAASLNNARLPPFVFRFNRSLPFGKRRRPDPVPVPEPTLAAFNRKKRKWIVDSRRPLSQAADLSSLGSPLKELSAAVTDYSDGTTRVSPIHIDHTLASLSTPPSVSSPVALSKDIDPLYSKVRKFLFQTAEDTDEATDLEDKLLGNTGDLGESDEKTAP